MSNNHKPKALCVDVLRIATQASDFAFETTADLLGTTHWLGQDRTVDAIKMSAANEHADFNAFVLGTPGRGKRTLVRALLQEAAKISACPVDWVYVNNFDARDKPIAIALPAGAALSFRKAMEDVIEDLANDIPALIESEDYQTRRNAIEQKFGEMHETAIGAVFEHARACEIVIMRTPMGFTVAGTVDGEVMTPETYEALTKKKRAAIDQAFNDIQEELAAAMKAFSAQQKAHRHEVEDLNFDVANAGVDAAIKVARAAFAEIAAVQSYIDAVRRNLIDNVEIFRLHEEGAEAEPFPVATTRHFSKPQFRANTVNVMVSRDSDSYAPIVEENLPMLGNLIGRTEYEADMGALNTDFTMIKPGALRVANGFYLILDAQQVLMEPFAWDALKRCLKTGEVAIYSSGERLSLVSTVSLVPEPIPLKVRVILLGERIHYYLLSALDPDFRHLFKLETDFNDHLDVAGDAHLDYARYIGGIAQERRIRPLTPNAMVHMFRESARLTSDADRLTLNVSTLSDILREADYWAADHGRDLISGSDVEEAIAKREHRVGRIRALSQEAILRETHLIDTEGETVGQVNSLSVLQVGGTRFGRPSRLTARTRMGSGKFVDIERETDLGGPIHSKGMLFLQGYLATSYAPESPMSLWASLVFEQSYGGVDGDSASAAELLALLSSLADVAVDQSFAMTGSVNQFGTIQAIGGVNEKIEGFFDICAALGLTGHQGVLIPASNVKHLCLCQRIIDAVDAGRFSIIPMTTISDVITTTTGMAPGTRTKAGRFRKGTFNWRVEEKLESFAQSRQSFGCAMAPEAK